MISHISRTNKVFALGVGLASAGCLLCWHFFKNRSTQYIAPLSNQCFQSKDEVECVGPRETFHLASIQMTVGFDKYLNLVTARNAIEKAATVGAKVVMLPEMFNCPYGNKYFEQYSEIIPVTASLLLPDLHPSTKMMSEMAAKHQIYLIGGSIPEHADDLGARKLYNTCVVFGPDGEIILRHRKVHLFDINVPGMVFRESDSLTPGDQISVFETNMGCKIGVGICYDMRFSLYAQSMAQHGAELLVYPSAFNTITGPSHWELLQRGRAIDNLVYVATASPSLDETFSYKAWGHSTIVSPWGNVIATTGASDDIVMAAINLNWVSAVRSRIPIRQQFRSDLYQLNTTS